MKLPLLLNPFEVSENAGKDGFSLFLARMLDKPYFRVTSLLCFITPIAKTYHILRGCAGAIFMGQRYPVVSVWFDFTEQVSQLATTNSTAVMPVIQTQLPMLSCEGIRQIEFTGFPSQLRGAMNGGVLFSILLIACQLFTTMILAIDTLFLAYNFQIFNIVSTPICYMFFSVLYVFAAFMLPNHFGIVPPIFAHNLVVASFTYSLQSTLDLFSAREVFRRCWIFIAAFRAAFKCDRIRHDSVALPVMLSNAGCRKHSGVFTFISRNYTTGSA